MKKVLTCLLLFAFTQFLFGQVPASLKVISKAIETHGDYEKIYLHTDRDYFTGGGDLVQGLISRIAVKQPILLEMA